MPRIVIFGATADSRTQLSRLLASSGHRIYRLCATDGELRRALTECEDGLVLIAGKLPGSPPDDLVRDFGSSFQFLLIGKPALLASCESREIFQLACPCSGSAIVAAVEILTQLHSMRLPKRSEKEKEIVEQAKRLLMQKCGIDEPEAHRRMQQHAMGHNMKMTDYALEIIQGGLDDA